MATLRQLEYLVAVVDEGSFTRAAAVLHVTQPALSHQMRVLERASGGPLLERLPRTVRLTAAGRAMLPHARAALADAARARDAARRVSGLTGGELRIATVYSIGLGVLPPVLRVWRRAHPSIRVRLAEYGHAADLRDAMDAGRADVAIGPAPADWPGMSRSLGIEELVVVLPRDDDVVTTGGAGVRLNRLADRDWVHYAPGNGLAEVLNDACAAAGFEPRAAVRTEQTAAAPILAAAGLGPALVPANIVPAGFGGRVLRPVPRVRRTLAAYSHGAPDPVVAAFVGLLVRRVRLMPTHVSRQLTG